MIDKVIHYCWFGGNSLDSVAIKCIASWKKHFPGYEIVQWNESNFDITRVEFMAKAYRDKKWAFVSDVARLLIIYENGGLYFDTDVEVIRSYEDILRDNPDGFFGFENDCFVNSGLGFGAIKGHPFLKKMIEEYEKLDFDQYKDRIGDVACPIITTELMLQNGLIKENLKQKISGITIYPTSYFAPIDYLTGKMKQTKETHSIHWYNASWHNEHTKREQERLRKLSAIVGTNVAENLYGIFSCVRNEGVFRYAANRVGKYIFRKEK